MDRSMSDDRVAADQDPSVGNRNLSALVVDDDFNGVFNIYERSKHDVSIYSNIDVGNRDSGGTYFDYLRRISPAWPHLKMLVAFMQHGTTPFGHAADAVSPEERQQRLDQTHVSVLDIVPEIGVVREDLFSKQVLLDYLGRSPSYSGTKGRLFVVEDLSSSVIEHLGSHFDIDPSFFRDHITSRVWFSTHDPSFDVPHLASSEPKRSYLSIEYIAGRFFNGSDALARAESSVKKFNVYRRVDTDQAREWTKAWGGPVGIVRSRMSLWVQNHADDKSPWVGIIIIDPTIKEGHPLWTGYGNFERPPSMHDQNVTKPPYSSAFEDFIYWATRKGQTDLEGLIFDPGLIAAPFYTMICSQWLLMTQYLTTRLNQLEWQIEGGLDVFHRAGFDKTLALLLVWRRRLATYTNYLESAIQNISLRYNMEIDGNTWVEVMQDFKDVRRRMLTLQDRAEKGLAVAVAVIAREDSKKATEESHAVTRVTYLAFVFVPLSFVSSFLSMSGDYPTMTYWIYFAIALPLCGIVFLVLIFSNRISESWNNRANVSRNVSFTQRSMRTKSEKDHSKSV